MKAIMFGVWYRRAPARARPGRRGCASFKRLREFQKDPAPVLALLELLRDDPER